MPLFIYKHIIKQLKRKRQNMGIIGTTDPKDKKLRQIGHIDENKDVTVEVSVTRGNRVALDLLQKVFLRH